ncbi:MAG: sigma-70 family RNA polymerase sigma factor [bacterium]|nr:sigma-70 family RNA polymerase sigma factor [bacterium]
MEPGQLFLRYRDEGDLKAFEQLMDQFHRSLFTYLMRMLGRRHEAEDALQEVWLKIISQKDKYEHRGQFVSWMYRIAHNHCLDSYRKSRRFVDVIETGDDDEGFSIIDSLPSGEQTPLDAAAEGEELSQLERAVASLPPLIREVYLLRAAEDVPFKEIAEIQNAPLGTVLSRMNQAIKYLRKSIQTAGGELAESTA